MMWLIVWGIVAAGIGAAWRLDRVLKQRRPVRPINDEAYVNHDHRDDGFADAMSYRRPAAGAGGGGGFFSRSGRIRR